MPWNLIADAVVAVLLVATIIYVRRFGIRLETIRSSRAEFEKLIADLTKSTDQAASHLHQFRSTADVAGRDLQARIERAQTLAAEFGKIGDDLKLLTERAESATGKLETAIGRSRAVQAAAPVVAPAAPAAAIELPDDEDDRRVA